MQIEYLITIPILLALLVSVRRSRKLDNAIAYVLSWHECGIYDYEAFYKATDNGNWHGGYCEGHVQTDRCFNYLKTICRSHYAGKQTATEQREG